jgi:transposase
MGEYNEGFKAAMVKKLAAGAKSATSLSMEVGVSQSTLSRWLREHATLGSGGTMSGKKAARNWTAQQKLSAVLEYEGLSEEARGKFLREKGLYSAELERWREQMLQALSGGGKAKGAEKARIRDLESELRRKEKALAETAALLVLKKKAQAIWGDSEDGKSSSQTD